MHRRNTRKLTLRVIASSKIAMSIFFCSWRWFWILLMELWVWRVAETVFVKEGPTDSVEDQNGGKTMLLIDRNALNNWKFVTAVLRGVWVRVVVLRECARALEFVFYLTNVSLFLIMILMKDQRLISHRCYEDCIFPQFNMHIIVNIYMKNTLMVKNNNSNAKLWSQFKLFQFQRSQSILKTKNFKWQFVSEFQIPPKIF